MNNTAAAVPTDLPVELWVHVLLPLLDVRDLVHMRAAQPRFLIPPDFVWRARRVLSDKELAWFVRSGITVHLLEEEITTKLKNSDYYYDDGSRSEADVVDFEAITEYKRNGKIHRDGDLPAVIITTRGGVTYRKEWRQDGLLHRENDQPAVVEMHRSFYCWRGKYHRPSGGPAMVFDDTEEEEVSYWYWHNELFGIRIGAATPVWWVKNATRPFWATGWEEKEEGGK